MTIVRGKWMADGFNGGALVVMLKDLYPCSLPGRAPVSEVPEG